VIAVEIDRDLIDSLRARMPSNVEIVEADALAVEFTQLTRQKFHVVGNLPYNVATPLIRKFISGRARILEVSIMLQKEVAERIRAKPGSHDYGPLSVLVQYYAEPTWGFNVSPHAFNPPPKVDSAVIRLDWKPNVLDCPDFTDFVHKAFSSRRKKLINNLAAVFPSRSRDELLAVLDESGIPVAARAETLSVEDFLRVYNRVRSV
jgi:16S rRNA (adenine1518-N6/adenine1519-N6)-dimethyltransferase